MGEDFMVIWRGLRRAHMECAGMGWVFRKVFSVSWCMGLWCMEAKVEVLDENDWWSKMEQMKRGGEQEMIAKRNYSCGDQQTLSDMAYQLGLYLGKTLVVSKVPLPNYRADLDESHGSTQKEIRMSTETERRVGNLLASSRGAVPVDETSGASSQWEKQSSLTLNISKSGSVLEVDTAKERFNVELKHRQEKIKASDSSKTMQSFREKLPASKVKSEFLKAVAANQVLVVSGETGCGKTTQLPQFILEEEISSFRGADCSIICTQPRRISAISVAARVSSERGESLGETVGYQIRLEAKHSAQTRLLFCTTGILLRQLDIDIDSHYKNYSTSTRHSLEAWSGAQLDLGLVSGAMMNIFVAMRMLEQFLYSSLVGMTIYKLLDKIKANSFLGNPSKFLVLPLHGSMPTINQRAIFDRPPSNVRQVTFIVVPIHTAKSMMTDLCITVFCFSFSTFRKIVLATNIAESSITIDDVVYVIDCGKAKETSYDALNKLACLLPSWISRASAHQRRGRAGRVQPGFCYRLYPKMIHDAMLQYQLPEILRMPLQELCLHIKSLQLGAVASFLAKALQPPDPLSVQNAIELLKTIGALDDMEELTPRGRHLCMLPLDPNIGKMLLMGSIFQCLDPALTIASALAHRDPFVLPINRKEEADAAKKSFAGDSCSDHIALLKAFERWKDAKRNSRERAFCWENFLSPVTLQMMEDMRSQFLDLLSDIGFVNKSRGAKAYNQYSDDLEMVCAILCAGLYPNVLQCKRRGKRTVFYTKEVGKVDIHPASVNAGVHLFPLPYMVYSEKVKTTSIYIRDLTNISDYALLLFGGNLMPSENGEGIAMLGGYLHFSASKSILELIQKLRGELDKLLRRKIEEPGLDIPAKGKGVVDAVIELLHSQNVRY
ncbi:hypothetical protein HHK36_016910 [Tetracentron sinense]|uniref:Helicase C-terminal domain-containing protein n=1 Tax=Tetracentron sinense TaxID=13715 RepID=A0A835DF50_TETSI|nr:hypothetical protein HHK36_016910 [Tetracentron sinense]